MADFSRRFLPLLTGLVVLAIPLLMFLNGLSESRSRVEEKNRTQAVETGEKIIELLGKNNLDRFLMDERLEQLSQDIAGEVSGKSLENCLPNLKSAAENALQSLEASGTVPRAFYLLGLPRDFRKVASLDGSEFVEVMKRGPDLDAEGRAFLESFLRRMVSDVVGIKNASDFREENASLSKYLGIAHDVGLMTTEARARIINVTWMGKPCEFFWQTINDFREVDRFVKAEPRGLRFPAGKSFFHPRFRPEFTIGAFVIIIEDPTKAAEVRGTPYRGSRTRRSSRIDSLVRNLRGSNSEVAFKSDDSEEWARNPEFPLADPGLAFPGGQRPFRFIPPDGWSIGTGTVLIDRPYKVACAVRIPELPAADVRKDLMIRAFAAVVFAVGAFWWILAVFRGRGFFSSLGRQLLGGFLVAAALPLGTTFFINDPLAEEFLENRCNQERQALLKEIDLVERKMVLHRPMLWTAIRKLFLDPVIRDCWSRLSNRMEVSLLPASSTSLTSDANALAERLFKDIFDPPLDLSVRKVILTDPNGITGEHPPEVRGEPGRLGLLAETVRDLTKPTFGDLGHPRSIDRAPDDLAPVGGRNSLSEARRELFLDSQKKVFLATLGPDTFLDFLFNRTEPVLIHAGIGIMAVLQVFVPCLNRPEFQATVFFKTEYNERNKLSFLFSGGRDDTRVFGFKRNLIGGSPIPETGERFPFLRLVAHQVNAVGGPLSLKVPFGTETFLVEGSPSKNSNLFIFVGMVPLSPLVEEADALRTRNLQQYALALFLIFLLALSTSRDFLRPISDLQAGIREVRDNILSGRLSADRSDELGDLCRAFNRMVGGLEQRNLLQRMVSSSAGRATQTSDDEALAREGRREEMTVLYFGIPGFEGLLETTDPGLLFGNVNSFLSTVCAEVQAFGGDVDKIIGEKILVTFSHRMHGAREAAGKAFALLEKLKTCHEQGVFPLPFSVGVNSGPLISGILGSGEQRDFTVIGDTVNVAARAQSISETVDSPHAVFSEASVRLLPVGVPMRSLGETNVKGKLIPVRLFAFTEESFSRAPAAIPKTDSGGEP